MLFKINDHSFRQTCDRLNQEPNFTQLSLNEASSLSVNSSKEIVNGLNSSEPICCSIVVVVRVVSTGVASVCWFNELVRNLKAKKLTPSKLTRSKEDFNVWFIQSMLKGY